MGIQALSRVDFTDNRNLVIFAISVAVGIIHVAVPGFYVDFPAGVQIVLDSGITMASLTAILLNVVFNVLGKGEGQPSPATDAAARAEEEV